ncbi:hypothetical protein LINPERPRIM_LOCUS8733 [Linum perenne]
MYTTCTVSMVMEREILASSSLLVLDPPCCLAPLLVLLLINSEIPFPSIFILSLHQVMNSLVEKVHCGLLLTFGFGVPGDERGRVSLTASLTF